MPAEVNVWLLQRTERALLFSMDDVDSQVWWVTAIIQNATDKRSPFRVCSVEHKQACLLPEEKEARGVAYLVGCARISIVSFYMRGRLFKASPTVTLAPHDSGSAQGGSENSGSIGAEMALFLKSLTRHDFFKSMQTSSRILASHEK